MSVQCYSCANNKGGICSITGGNPFTENPCRCYSPRYEIITHKQNNEPSYAELQAKNERLKAEELKHRKDKMTMTLKYNEVLNDLNDENEKLKCELKDLRYNLDDWRNKADTMEARVKELEAELKQTEAQYQVVIDSLRKENAKLRCTALHLFLNLADREMIYYMGLNVLNAKQKSKRWARIRTKCVDAYKIAKNKLKEGK